MIQDREMSLRHRYSTGAFYTPLPFAHLAHRYIIKSLDPLMYSLWDPCAGTGHLADELPSFRQVFLSTLDPEDVILLVKAQFPCEPKIFRFDFLNQPDTDLLPSLREALVPHSKWVFLLNPPYVSHTSGFIAGVGIVPGIRLTNVYQSMGASRVSQSLHLQFLWHVYSLITLYQLDAYVGVFCPSQIFSYYYQEFFYFWTARMEFLSGFSFNMSEFSQTRLGRKCTGCPSLVGAFIEPPSTFDCLFSLYRPYPEVLVSPPISFLYDNFILKDGITVLDGAIRYSLSEV